MYNNKIVIDSCWKPESIKKETKPYLIFIGMTFLITLNEFLNFKI
ncbi:hypothetical protein RCH33_236 [Flavobacterium daejeonense]|nr:hypothetical protein RCH33_236 [Flavobacterium daejeonense]